MKCYHWTLQQACNLLVLKKVCFVTSHFILETVQKKNIQQFKKKKKKTQKQPLLGLKKKKTYLKFMQIQWVGLGKRSQLSPIVSKKLNL